jgi:hypothetical protein
MIDVQPYRNEKFVSTNDLTTPLGETYENMQSGSRIKGRYRGDHLVALARHRNVSLPRLRAPGRAAFD